MEFIKKQKLLFIGIIVGMIGGYLYYIYFGCTEGCSITSKPINSTLYGGLMGGLIFDMFKKKKRKQ